MKTREFLNDWSEHIIRGSVRTGTYTVYRGYIDNHINGRIGDAELEELNTRTLQEFAFALRDGQRALSDKTVRCVFAMLSSALRYAVESGHLIKNPCFGVRLPKAGEKEIRIFTKAEQARIERTVLSSPDKRGIAVLVCAYTGIRIGELCGLRWGDLDLGARTLTVRRSLGRVKDYASGAAERKTKLALQEPKTEKSKRLLPLPDFLCGILRRLRAESGGGFVFTVRGRKALEPRALQFLYKGILKEAGVEFRNFHTLRHTFASRIIELGADIKTASEILGHSGPAVTLNRYAHSLMEQKQAVMNKLGDGFLRNKTAAASAKLRKVCNFTK
ncbi:MAG: site-specific integrase [Clostridiales bacterium]|jgi:integrase|nr:site-specific integrase [Clostridiales bacterium]